MQCTIVFHLLDKSIQGVLQTERALISSKAGLERLGSSICRVEAQLKGSKEAAARAAAEDCK